MMVGLERLARCAGEVTQEQNRSWEISLQQRASLN